MSGPKTSVLSINFERYSDLSDSEKERWAEKEIVVNLEVIQNAFGKLEELGRKLEEKRDMVQYAVDCEERINKLMNDTIELLQHPLDNIDIDKEYSESELWRIRFSGAINVGFYGEINTSKLKHKYLDYFNSIKDNSLKQKISISRTLASRSGQIKRNIRELELINWDLTERIKDDALQEGIKTSFLLPFRKINSSENSKKLIEKINDSLSSVSTMLLSDELLDKFIALKEKASEIKDASYLSNFYQLVVRPFVEECTQYDKFYKENISVYEEYRTSYIVLCDELDLVPQELALSQEAIDFYKTKVKELQEIITKQKARETLMSIVNETMLEMGYDMIGSRDVVKKTGKKYHDELFSYGDGTAISVIHSSDGQMTMEIGGVDYGDRNPTDNEAKEMSKQMVSFCKDFGAISEALAQKGVDMKMVSMLPPDEQYAMIINLDDYSIDRQVKTITEVQKNDKKTSEEKKSMHVEE